LGAYDRTEEEGESGEGKKERRRRKESNVGLGTHILKKGALFLRKREKGSCCRGEPLPG